MDIETDIERIKSLAEAKEDENWRFRAYLKGLDLSEASLDRLVWRHLDDIAPRIDCCACANCCTVISPLLSYKDVRRLADHLGIEKTQVIREHLRLSKERSRYEFQHRPCQFLHDKRCTVYEARPDDCRSFPHLHKREFISRLIGVVENCSICPIVYNVFERLKMELWGRRRR
ncbi:MAG: YkgJ family cysteine cluster protein [Syntrophorhabdales bacterium]|jgi:Fe-S-cluster containining protein